MSAWNFEPDAVRASLPALQLGQAPPPRTEAQQAYLTHYGIDFTAGHPGLSHHLGTLAPPDHVIAVHCWQPRQARAAVVLVHGYFDHVGLYGHLIRHLLDAQMAVLAFDLPGHGLSSGDRATIGSFDMYTDSFDECLRSAARELPQPWHVVGQSTGGAVAMQWLMAHAHNRASSPFDKVVLLAPLVRPYLWVLNRWLYFGLRPFVDERPRTFANNSDDPEFLRFLRDDDPLQARVLPVQWVTAMVQWQRRFVRYPPTDIAPLVIQGQNDRTVDWRYNLRVIKRLFVPRIVYLPKARHHLVNESPVIRQQVFQAITQELA